MKILIYILIIPIIIILIIAFFWYSNFGHIPPVEKIEGKYKLEINKAEKEFLKEIKNKIYQEATVHNPEGDVLPDQIDDKIIDETKNYIDK